MMDSTSRRRSVRTWILITLLGACTIATSSVRAATYTWDPSGNRTDAAGGGTWNTTSSNWDNGTADVPWNNNSSSAAIFGGADGTYALTVANGISALGVTFNASGYTLAGASAASPGTLTILTTGSLLVASGKTLTVGANMTLGGIGFVNNSAGYTGGTINVVSNGVFNPSTFATLGGNYNISESGTMGAAANSYVVNGATMTVNGTGANFQARGAGFTDTTVTLTQGAFNISGGSGTAFTNTTINLNGGTFTGSHIVGSTANSTFNFNGGVFKDDLFYGGFINNGSQAMKLVVQTGGAKFNLPSAMTLPLALLHDANGPAIDGGVTLQAGTLTLSVAGTYTGGTTVSGGTLAVSANGALGSGDASVLATSVKLSIGTGVTSPFSNMLARLTLAGGGAAGTADAGYLDLTSGANITVGSLVLGGTTYTSGVFSSANAPDYISGTGTVTVVPEPGSLALALFVAGALGFGRMRRAHRMLRA